MSWASVMCQVCCRCNVWYKISSSWHEPGLGSLHSQAMTLWLGHCRSKPHIFSSPASCRLHRALIFQVLWGYGEGAVWRAAWFWPHAEAGSLSSVNGAAPAGWDAPARALIESSWHSLGSVIIPTGICLALEKGAKSLWANTKTKDSSLCQALRLGAGSQAETMWSSSFFATFLLPGLLYHGQVVAFPGLQGSH
jgi:hypothetical protein